MLRRLVLNRFTALGQDRIDFPDLSQALPPGAEIDGVLGLDFLRGQVLTLDFRVGLITLSFELSRRRLINTKRPSRPWVEPDGTIEVEDDVDRLPIMDGLARRKSSYHEMGTEGQGREEFRSVKLHAADLRRECRRRC